MELSWMPPVLRAVHDDGMTTGKWPPKVQLALTYSHEWAPTSSLFY
jgi:hypothetical protein